jgi:hypothetical protein
MPIALREDKEPVSPPAFSVIRISEGLAFGEGSISSHVENPQILTLMDEAIHSSPNILIAVNSDDDGCSDGREPVEVYTQYGAITENIIRAKVFGGSVAMTTAAAIGLGQTRDQLLQRVFDQSINTLLRNNMNFGAHTDVHARDPNCGCGAIDKAPEALIAALKYESAIRGVIAVLGIDPTGIEAVYANFRRYMTHEMAIAQEYSGISVMDHILAAGKIIKRLGGNHLEKRIVINQIKGYTVNQKLLRDVTEGHGQVFGIDVWRLDDIATGLFPNRNNQQHEALLSELIYTLGTAGVLTPGDLPVDLIQAIA